MEPEPPPQAVQRLIGPYRVRHAWTGHEETASDGHADARRALARDELSGRVHTVVLPAAELADDRAYGVRFRAEAENSRRLPGPWFAPVVAMAPPGAGTPWVAHDCFPALPLPDALTVHGGPLPAATVRALGRALAQALTTAHANGLVHAGISRGSVLLTPYGPRLSGYGLVRAAALDGVDRTGVPGIDRATLPPEQRAGGRPRPPGDIYALGAVLAYAATGRTAVGVEEAPAELRAVVAACLSEDPAHRPLPAALVHELATGAPGHGPDDGGLPAAVATALADQAAAHPAVTVPDRDATRPPTAPADGRRPRRALLAGLTCGAAGLLVGGGGVAAVRAAGVGRPAPRPPLFTRGAAPAPLWRHELQGDAPMLHPLERGRTALVNLDSTATAVDLRTGRQLWARDDIFLQNVVQLDAGTAVLVAESGPDLTLFSLRTGRITWAEDRYRDPEQPQAVQVLAAAGKRLWFWASEGEASDGGKGFVVAYDWARHKEVWRTPLPAGFGRDTLDIDVTPMMVLTDTLALPGLNGDSDTPMSFAGLRRGDGKHMWTQDIESWPVLESLPVRMVTGGRMVFCGKSAVHAHDFATGREPWKAAAGRTYSSQDALATHADRLYVADVEGTVHALDARHGTRLWRRSTFPRSSSDEFAAPEVTVSHSGRTVLHSNGTEIDALDAADGSVRWRLALTGKGEYDQGAGAFVASPPGMVVVMNDNSLYAFPVD